MPLQILKNQAWVCITCRIWREILHQCRRLWYCCLDGFRTGQPDLAPQPPTFMQTSRRHDIASPCMPRPAGDCNRYLCPALQFTIHSRGFTGGCRLSIPLTGRRAEIALRERVAQILRVWYGICGKGKDGLKRPTAAHRSCIMVKAAPWVVVTPRTVGSAV